MIKTFLDAPDQAREAVGHSASPERSAWAGPLNRFRRLTTQQLDAEFIDIERMLGRLEHTT